MQTAWRAFRRGPMVVALLPILLPVLPAAFFILHYMLPTLDNWGAARLGWSRYQIVLVNLYAFLLPAVTLGIFGALSRLKPGERGFVFLGLLLIAVLARTISVDPKDQAPQWLLYFAADMFSVSIWLALLLNLVRLLPAGWKHPAFIFFSVLTLTPVIGMQYGILANNLFEASLSSLNREHFIDSVIHEPWLSVPLILLTALSSYLIACKALPDIKPET